MTEKTAMYLEKLEELTVYPELDRSWRYWVAEGYNPKGRMLRRYGDTKEQAIENIMRAIRGRE
jgi:hypothetical protein